MDNLDAWAASARQRIKDDYGEMLAALDAWRAAELATRDVIEGIGTQNELAEKQRKSDLAAKRLMKLVAAQVL